MDVLSISGNAAASFPYPQSSGRRDGDAGWRELPVLPLDSATMRGRRIDIDGSKAGADIWGELRTRTAQTMMRNEWHVVGVTSPTVGCGATTVAANLAFGLARQSNCRVVLIDLNLHEPVLSRRLGLDKVAPLGEYLRGHKAASDCFCRFGDSLAVGFNTIAEGNSSELLLDARAQLALAELRRQLSPDFVIIDLPPMIGSDEVLACLPLLDCALLVAGANKTTFGEVDLCESELSERSNMLGVVLNMCRDGPALYGY